MQRVHWDPEFARRSGNPTTFDYGRMRETWLIHLCTDWMGDEGWLWKLDCEFRKFNYVGDTQWLSGTVSGPLPGGRAARPRRRAPGREPARRAHDAGSRNRPPPEPGARVRSVCPSRRGAGDLQEALTAISERYRADERRDDGEPYRSVEGLRIERRGPVLEFEIDRPKKRNALTDPIVAAMISALVGRRARRVRAGDRVARRRGSLLCRLRHRRAATQTDARPRVGSIQRRLPTEAHRLVELLLSTQTPVVCRVQGWAAGIGLHLVLASDFAVVDESARLWEPYAQRGFTPDTGGTWLLARRIGEVRAREMLLLGEAVSGADAADWGMVHRRRAGRRPRRSGADAGRAVGRGAHGHHRADQMAAARRLGRATGRTAAERGPGHGALVAERGLS